MREIIRKAMYVLQLIYGKEYVASRTPEFRAVMMKDVVRELRTKGYVVVPDDFEITAADLAAYGGD